MARLPDPLLLPISRWADQRRAETFDNDPASHAGCNLVGINTMTQLIYALLCKAFTL